MIEKQPHSPEASKATIRDLYRQAADYLGTMCDKGSAVTEPGFAPFMVKVSVDVPDLNRKRLHLEYQVPNEDDDPTVVDTSLPLAHTDETGRNHWATPIQLKVYGEDGGLIHDYTLEISPDPNHARAYDEHAQEDPETREIPQITSLDAKELTAHLQWALEGAND